MAGMYRDIVENDKKFKEAKYKTIGDYEKEAEVKKANTLPDALGGKAESAIRNRKKQLDEAASYKKGGKIDGCAQRGKTRGRVV